MNYFREVSQVVPGCGTPSNFLSDTTVAAPIQNGPFRCGDQVLILGLGSGGQTAKTVTDECPACEQTLTQLDNFNTSSACGLTSLGNFKTIRINR
jgi:hypothetical protein